MVQKFSWRTRGNNEENFGTATLVRSTASDGAVTRAFYNELRGLIGSAVVFPLAERLEGRSLQDKQRLFDAEMALPFAMRRRRSWQRLCATVRFAAAHVPYYRDLFATIAFDPASLERDPKYLQDIPVLTKDIIRSEGERLLRDDHRQFRKFVSKTGGSTGPSAAITYDQDAADWSSAVTRHARACIGAGSMRLELHLAARFQDAFPLKDRLREQIKCLANNRINVTFSSYAADELGRIWREIAAARPYLVHGHPSTLHQLAIHAAATDLPRPAFDIFESSGETLDRKQRRVIQELLKCTVINRYGLAEAGVVAYQTDRARPDMQVFDPLAWPEVLDVDYADELPQVDDGRSGELAITTLRNEMMPLIRYRTGDATTLRETPTGFRLADIFGRVHDVVEIGGVKMPTHHIQDELDRIGGIAEFQIMVGTGRPTLSLVLETDAATELIRRKIEALWGNEIEIAFVAADALKLQGWRSKFRHLVAPAGASP